METGRSNRIDIAHRRHEFARASLPFSVLLLAVALSLSSCKVPHPGESSVPAAVQQVEQSDATFEAIDLEWLDSTRERAVPARLYWPKQLVAKPVPLIVFSHGIGGSRNGYSYLGSFWASHGYASLHVQHVGSDRSLWRGNVFSLVPRLQNAAQDAEAVERVSDLRFALDSMLASRYGTGVDANRIIAAGHSYGANTVMLAVGAKVERNGKVIQFRDERFRAAIVISAPPFYGETKLAPILSNIRIPTLHITCTDDTISIPGYESPASDRIKVFEAMGGSLKILTVFEGGSHSIFTDRPVTGGINLNPKIKEATQTLSLAFLQRVFEGAGEATVVWGKDYHALVSQFVTAGN